MLIVVKINANKYEKSTELRILSKRYSNKNMQPQISVKNTVAPNAKAKIPNSSQDNCEACFLSDQLIDQPYNVSPQNFS